MPKAPSLTTLLLRIFSGIAGGLLGVISALLVVFLASFANVGAETLPSSLTISFSHVTILGMVFVGTLVSNLSVSLLFGFFEREKYPSIRRMSLQVFIFTLLLFILFIPSYLFSSENQLSIATLHFFSSAIITLLITEIMSGWQNSLTGLLGVVISGSFVFGLFAYLFQISLKNSVLLLFALPLVWMFLVLGVYLAEVIRTLLMKISGTDTFSPIENIQHSQK